MSDAPLPPQLPVYETPAPRACAILPKSMVKESVKTAKPPGTLSKMISKMLPKKLGKLAKSPKLKAKLPSGKPTKKRHKVRFK
jgi:hypothetical protein